MIGGPPRFLDDKESMPLQAADLHAGWAREVNAKYFASGQIAAPIWREKAANIKVLTWFMDDSVARDIKQLLATKNDS